MEKYKDLLNDLAKTLKLESIDIDSNNQAHLLFDDIFLISINFDQSRNEICLSSELEQIEEDRIKNVYPKLLEKNLFWQETAGATFSLKDNKVNLLQRINLNSLSKETFESFVETFVNITEYWTENLKTL